MAHPRGYHSSAILLTDGSVLMGGDPLDAMGHTPHDRFFPGYCFLPRPTIAGAPATVGYGAPFTVNTPDAPTIGEVVLMRPGAVTHGFNQSQRLVGCTFTSAASSLSDLAATGPPGLAGRAERTLGPPTLGVIKSVAWMGLGPAFLPLQALSLRSTGLAGLFLVSCPQFGGCSRPMQPPKVVGQAHQLPLQRHFHQTPQEELPESNHRLDNPEDRFNGFLSEFVERFALSRFHPSFHDLTHAGSFCQRFRFGFLFQIGHCPVVAGLFYRRIHHRSGGIPGFGLFDLLDGLFAKKAAIG